MSGLLEMFGMASKLAEIHGLVTRLYGDKFAGHVADWEPLLRAVAKEKHDGNIIGAATELAKAPDADERWTLLILAIAVELTKRDKAAAQKEAAA